MNVLNGACAVLAITPWAAGCATSAPATDPIRVTTTPADVAGCNLLGKVIVSDTAPDAAKEARGCANEAERDAARSLFERLSWHDQNVFDATPPV